MDGVAFEAGRIMLKRLRQLGDVKADFAFECAQLAVRRVKLRVALGGHDVPGDVVRRRFGRSLSNFFMLCAPLADEWTLFDNSETKRRAR